MVTCANLKSRATESTSFKRNWNCWLRDYHFIKVIKQVKRWNIIYLNYGERYEDMIDRRS